MHSSPPFPHVQKEQDRAAGDTPAEVAAKNACQGFIMFYVVAMIILLSLAELAK